MLLCKCWKWKYDYVHNVGNKKFICIEVCGPLDFLPRWHIKSIGQVCLLGTAFQMRWPFFQRRVSEDEWLNQEKSLTVPGAIVFAVRRFKMPFYPGNIIEINNITETYDDDESISTEERTIEKDKSMGNTSENSGSDI